MKTAVSIPDEVFMEAEALARRCHVSRSQLYATALRALIAQDAEVTRRLDDVYGDVNSDRAVTIAAHRVLAASEW